MSKTKTKPENWTWTYSNIPCTLHRQGRKLIGSIRVAPDHPWFGAAPDECLLRGEAVSIEGTGVLRCYRHRTTWTIECEFNGRSKFAPSDAAFELELLADAAVYLARHGVEQEVAA